MKAVHLQGVRFGWRGEALIEIHDMSVARGERACVVGPSGCGKSTLLALIGGVLTPTEGTVEVLGESVSAMSPRSRDRFRADHVGFVFQQFNLVPYLSTLSNVTLPCQFSRVRRDRASGTGSSVEREAIRLLEALGLGVGDLGGRAVTELSIGQQQRVAAARALMGQPELLIADEPTSALDRANAEQFLELLFEECRRCETTVIMVTHDTDLAGAFERRIEFPDS